MSSDRAHVLIDQFAQVLEFAGVGIILCGVVVASALLILKVWREGLREGLEKFRSNVGQGILLGLELLVGADIISTITAPLSPRSVGLLAGIVGIRTFLSFSLETEIGGCWPWQRAQCKAPSGMIVDGVAKSE